MKIYLGKPPKPGGPEKFSIGEQMARPTDKQYKKMGFEKPLKRLAKMLAKQGPASAIGVEIHGISITWLLDPHEPKSS